MVDAARGGGPRARRRVQPPPARRHPDAQVESIDAGRLGRLYYAKAWWLRRTGIPTLGSWFTSAEQAGGGPLLDIGVHVLDYALFLLGQPQVTTVSASTYDLLGTRRLRLRARRWTRPAPPAPQTFDVEDLATVFMRLEDGGTLLVEASWAAHRTAGDEFGITLFGTEGGAELRVRRHGADRHAEDLHRRGGRGRRDDAQPAGRHRPRRGRGASSSSRSATAARADGSGAAELARVVDACYRSAAERREIRARRRSRPPGASQRSASARARSGSRWKSPTRTARIASKRRSPRSTSSSVPRMISRVGVAPARPRRPSSASGRWRSRARRARAGRSRRRRGRSRSPARARRAATSSASTILRSRSLTCARSVARRRRPSRRRSPARRASR